MWWPTRAAWWSAGPHTVPYPHRAPPLGALLIWWAVCGAGGLTPPLAALAAQVVGQLIGDGLAVQAATSLQEQVRLSVTVCYCQLLSLQEQVRLCATPTCPWPSVTVSYCVAQVYLCVTPRADIPVDTDKYPIVDVVVDQGSRARRTHTEHSPLRAPRALPLGPLLTPCTVCVAQARALSRRRCR